MVLQDCTTARRALDTFGGGRVAIVIFGAPYPCPPAPYECAMLLDDHLRQRGLRERTQLCVVTVQPMLLPNAGAEGSAWIGERLDERGIKWQVGRKAIRVERGRVVFEDGDLPFDLLLALPPHRPPAVLDTAGLPGDSGWIEPDRRRSRRPRRCLGSQQTVALVGLARTACPSRRPA